MADSSQSFRAVRSGGAYKVGALTFRRLGERLKRVGRTKQSDDDLVRVIETEVLPRLMLVHKQVLDDVDSKSDDELEIPEAMIDDFTATIVDVGTAAANETVLDLVARGTRLEDVFLKLLAPSARQMGDKWMSDELSFVDVTIGLCRLHELLRQHGYSGETRHPSSGQGQPSILLSTGCDDQHVFGVQMVAEFFRRDGWQVCCEPAANIDELARIVGTQKFDIAGLSLGNSVDAVDLMYEIDLLREASANRNIKILLGGSLMTHSAEIANTVGADLVSTDATSAPSAARALLATTLVGA